jgi:hypothetical protein
MLATFPGLVITGALGVAVALAAAVPVQAQTPAAPLSDYRAKGDQFYSEPAEAPHGLRFADLEASMPTDPLSWSSDPGWQLHRTPADQMAEATDVLRAAIPVGTAAADAAAVMQRAGARCAASGSAQLVCRYRDAETPYSGQYWDNILWRAWLNLADGRVSSLVVTRDWTRR